jgi:hypothetical protein
LRPRDPRQSWQRGSTRGQMRQLSAWKFHRDLSSIHSLSAQFTNGTASAKLK